MSRYLCTHMCILAQLSLTEAQTTTGTISLPYQLIAVTYDVCWEHSVLFQSIHSHPPPIVVVASSKIPWPNPFWIGPNVIQMATFLIDYPAYGFFTSRPIKSNESNFIWDHVSKGVSLSSRLFKNAKIHLCEMSIHLKTWVYSFCYCKYSSK